MHGSCVRVSCVIGSDMCCTPTHGAISNDYYTSLCAMSVSVRNLSRDRCRCRCAKFMALVKLDKRAVMGLFFDWLRFHALLAGPLCCYCTVGRLDTLGFFSYFISPLFEICVSNELYVIEMNLTWRWSAFGFTRSCVTHSMSKSPITLNISLIGSIDSSPVERSPSTEVRARLRSCTFFVFCAVAMLLFGGLHGPLAKRTAAADPL